MTQFTRATHGLTSEIHICRMFENKEQTIKPKGKNQILLSTFATTPIPIALSPNIDVN